jgi:hypothetical protein
MATADQTTNNSPYSAADITAAYKAVYGGLPAGMMDLRTGDLSQDYASGIYPGAVLQTPGGQQIDASQLMFMYQSSPAGQAAAAAAGGGAGAAAPAGQTATSYLNSPSTAPAATNTATSTATAAPAAASGGSMNWDQVANQFGLSSNDVSTFIQQGWDPSGFANQVQTSGGKMPTQGPQTPEQIALAQIAKTDPQSEALRQQVAGSYTDPNQAANPTAAQYQSYLNTFQQVDPEEYAQRQGLATSMDSYLKSVQGQYALGSQLDPVTQMQVEQQARKGQADRGNLYGSGQAAVEAMTTGQAGQALLQQRQAALQSALGGQQSYLGAGLGLGDTAMQLYQQGLQNKANAQQGALSYLSSGQTPYQTGAGYLSAAEANAANAAQGGPQYNPASLGAGQLGTAQQAPQYGLDVGAQSQNYFNSLNNAYGGGGAATKNRGAAAGAGALSGALGGAASGATMGSAIPGVGTAIGGIVGAGAGALMGGASGYYS